MSKQEKLLSVGWKNEIFEGRVKGKLVRAVGNQTLADLKTGPDPGPEHWKVDDE